jgi:lactate 2-monooxygenase
MSRYNLPPSHTHHPFPYYPHKLDEIAMKPDKEGEEMRKHMKMSLEFTREGTNGMFRTWEDFAFVRKNWEGPILMKGIMSVKDARKAIEVGADGIVVSNHGLFSPSLSPPLCESDC